MIRTNQAMATPAMATPAMDAHPDPLVAETTPALMTLLTRPGECVEVEVEIEGVETLSLWTRLGPSGQQRLAQHWAVLIRRMRLQIQVQTETQQPPAEASEGSHEPQ